LQGTSQSNLLEPTPINPLLSLINRVGAEDDFAPNSDKEFESTGTTLEDSKPRAKNLNPITTRRTNAQERSIAENETIATSNAAAINDSVQADTTSNVAFPSRFSSFFTPMEQQLIYSWMTLTMGPAAGPLPVPPYAQQRKKELLLKPLTAYNYYFRDERINIVSQVSVNTDPIPRQVSEYTISKLQSLLYERWYVDPVKKKRRHRKSHGKIDFHRLSKVISERWRELPQLGRDFYRAVSQYDTMYYQQHTLIIQHRPDIV
jgi:hypothetical protein